MTLSVVPMITVRWYCTILTVWFKDTSYLVHAGAHVPCRCSYTTHEVKGQAPDEYVTMCVQEPVESSRQKFGCFFPPQARRRWDAALCCVRRGAGYDPSVKDKMNTWLNHATPSKSSPSKRVQTCGQQVHYAWRYFLLICTRWFSRHSVQCLKRARRVCAKKVAQECTKKKVVHPRTPFSSSIRRG